MPLVARAVRRFVIEQVSPGEHQLALLHPALDSLDIALPDAAAQAVTDPAGQLPCAC